jgi:demethylmenaquinone methyltransferase/2-methoxy-6-polyprenyl-1,4-benzoquinol methylase/phosphoethanolamine N-methyltransferase
MVDLLPLHDGDAVLDVGCGTGDLAIEVVKRVGSLGKVVGIDGSEEMITRARQKAHRRHLPLEFRVEEIERLALPDHSFDVVVSSLLFHALAVNLKLTALARIARVLKEGGHLMIIDFLNASGQILTHSRQPADLHDLPTLLCHAGFEPVGSGRIPFVTVGIPPLGYVCAQLPCHESA